MEKESAEFQAGEKYMIYLANGQVFLGEAVYSNSDHVFLKDASMVNFEDIENLVRFGAIKKAWFQGEISIKQHYVVTSKVWEHLLPEAAPSLMKTEAAGTTEAIEPAKAE